MNVHRDIRGCKPSDRTPKWREIIPSQASSSFVCTRGRLTLQPFVHTQIIYPCSDLLAKQTFNEITYLVHPHCNQFQDEFQDEFLWVSWVFHSLYYWNAWIMDMYCCCIDFKSCKWENKPNPNFQQLLCCHLSSQSFLFIQPIPICLTALIAIVYSPKESSHGVLSEQVLPLIAANVGIWVAKDSRGNQDGWSWWKIDDKFEIP